MMRPGHTPAGLPRSLASSTSITSTLTASSSTQSLAPAAPATRLRSNSSLSAPPPMSPTEARHAGPQARAQAQGHPASPRVDHIVSSTPPPRPPRGPLRSPGAPRSPNVPATVNGSAADHVQVLLRKALEGSRDGGETLDLSRDKLDRIGDEEVEFFRDKVGKERKGVWRLALSYNNLRDHSIVPSFATLHRLRYLNLKGNHLTVVPPAVSTPNAPMLMTSCLISLPLRFWISQRISSRLFRQCLAGLLTSKFFPCPTTTSQPFLPISRRSTTSKYSRLTTTLSHGHRDMCWDRLRSLKDMDAIVEVVWSMTRPPPETRTIGDLGSRA